MQPAVSEPLELHTSCCMPKLHSLYACRDLSYELQGCCLYSLRGCGKFVSAELGTASIAQHAAPLLSAVPQIDMCADMLAYVAADGQMLIGGQQSSSIAPACKLCRATVRIA